MYHNQSKCGNFDNLGQKNLELKKPSETVFMTNAFATTSNHYFNSKICLDFSMKHSVMRKHLELLV